MHIERIILGELATNCYIVEKNNNVIIIDPAANFEEIKKVINNRHVIGCLVTHFHFDHIGALKEILKEYRINVNDYDKLTSFNFIVLPTPGHTSDSQTFYFPEEKIMFTGDFIFQNSIGRTDLPTGNFQDMIKSLNNMTIYPDDIKIYPGHGNVTTLGIEKNHFKYYF